MVLGDLVGYSIVTPFSRLVRDLRSIGMERMYESGRPLKMDAEMDDQEMDRGIPWA